MAAGWKAGLLVGVFAAAAGFGGWATHSQMKETVRTALEQDGYTHISLSATWVTPGSGCNIARDRFAYEYTAAAPEGKPASGRACVTSLRDPVARILPDKTAP